VSVILAGVVCEQHLLDAVNARADALARADAVALRRLLHPDFRWTSHRGEVVDRETYIDNNTCKDLVRKANRFVRSRSSWSVGSVLSPPWSATR